MRPHPVSFAGGVLMALALCLALAPASARAAIDLTTTLTLPDTVTVGQDGLRADLVVTNTSTAGESLTLCKFGEAAPCPAGGEGITVLPSCGVAPIGVCTTADPGVLYLHGRGVGVSGQCAGVPFIVSDLPSGRYRLDPPLSTQIVLPAGGSCAVALAFGVIKQPATDADGTAANGLQTIAIGAATGRATTGASITYRDGEVVTVDPAPPPAAAPPAPLVTESSPASPANDNAPKIKGSAQTGSTVQLYTDAACAIATGAPTAAATFELTGITVAVPDNSTTSFYAKATDADGPSPCSTTSVTYVEDSVAPPAPTVLGTFPASPSTDIAPDVYGSADPGSTVGIFSNAQCTGDPLSTGASTQFASPGIAVVVGANTTTAFYAAAIDEAGNRGCSTTFALYTVTTDGPAPPVFTDSDPDSPANDNMPFIKGTAVAGGVVRLYANSACTGPRFGEGLSAAFASPGLQTSVLNDSTTTLYGTVTTAGTTSACSSSSITYVEDSTPPETAIQSGPAATVAAGSTVRFEFSSSEPGSRFACHLHAPGFQPCVSPATYPALPAGASSGSPQFQVRAIDRAGNEDGSPAARSYTVAAAPVPPPPPAPPPGCTLRVAPIVGTAAANTINGTARADAIFGRAGNDALRGLAGSDCLYGEAGNDRLRGGSGADRLLGGPGADRLEGESGNDRMTGAAGNDRLTDHSGRDTFSGGAGNDRIDARDTSLAGRRVRDTVRCGTGPRDVALADRRDLVLRDCERIVRR